MWWYICGADDGNIVLFGGLRLQFDWTNACVPCTKPCARFPSLHKCTPVSSHPQWRGRRFRMLKSGWGDGSVGKHWTEEITWVHIHRNHINKLGLLTCSCRHSTVVSGVEIPGTNCASIALGPVRDPVSKEGGRMWQSRILMPSSGLYLYTECAYAPYLHIVCVYTHTQSKWSLLSG